MFYFQISTTFFIFFCYTYVCCNFYNHKRKGVYTVNKIGTITVSVFKSDDNSTSFKIETDDDDVLPVSYVIEDTLKFY